MIVTADLERANSKARNRLGGVSVRSGVLGVTERTLEKV
jgi:hypothetical protein